MEQRFRWDAFKKSDAIEKNSLRPSNLQISYSKKLLAHHIDERNRNLGFCANPTVGDRYGH
jgi:hypothetical protein